jgi:hypothetical protein
MSQDNNEQLSDNEQDEYESDKEKQKKFIQNFI